MTNCHTLVSSRNFSRTCKLSAVKNIRDPELGDIQVLPISGSRLSAALGRDGTKERLLKLVGLGDKENEDKNRVKEYILKFKNQ